MCALALIPRTNNQDTMRLGSLCSLLLFTAVSATLGTKSSSSHAKAIIIDTDIMTDVDDVGALAIANVLHNCGLCDLRGVVVNTQSRYGALATSVSSH